MFHRFLNSPQQNYLFKQLPLTKITHISTLKLALGGRRLFGVGAMEGRELILPRGFWEGWGNRGGICLGCSNPPMQELQEPKLVSHEKQFVNYGF